ncbi:MAG: hypothetical protein IBX55_11590 [Methyloprofundus sp.]|nr:hypothetical protein [Methyloprofundus sp.]
MILRSIYMKKFLALFSAASAFLFTSIASASSTYTPGANDPFGEFMTTVDSWAKGAYGVGAGIASILVGGAYAVGKNSPMPALAGLATAAFIYWGPGVVKTMITGAVIS